MCGFIGVLNNKRGILIKKELFESLGKLMKYRGPDESGFFSDGPYGVYHQRLRVIDLTSAGKQPMQNREGTISIAYNGEVYNFKDLKKRYVLDGKFEFRSTTDTEVLLYLYELLGIDFVHELNGMFAIAIWDSRIRKLYLIRDRFGIKPLFYTTLPEGALWFSSEIKSLLNIPGFDRKVCFKAVHHYFSFNYIPGAITAFEGIEEVKPGYFLEIHSDRITDIKEMRYWQPSYGNLRADNLGKTIGDIRELLKNSVKYQLISDVPVGVMLSGGLDSSTLAVLMSQIRKDSDFHTFSIGFDDKTFDESIYAEIVAKYLKTIHHKIKITPKSVAENIKKCILHIDEPYADGSAIPTYLLSQEAKNYVTVLLSGEGGDEVFAGYETYLAYFVKQAYGSSPDIFKNSMRGLAKVLPVSYKKLSLSFKIKKFIEGAEKTIPVSHYKWREVFSEEEKRKLLNIDRNLELEYGPSCDLFSVRFMEINALDALNKLLGIDCTYHLPDDLMIKNDRMTMAHSLEARVPFTDLELFEYLANFAGGTKIHGLQLKYLLRKAMEPFLPRQILSKKKVGLELPYSKWFCSELKELLLDHLSESALKDIPFINSSYPQQLIREHLNKKADRGRELWGLLNFVIWYRLYFIDKIY
jgi:asparagine synthase (glutamine-hydrolysing)